MEPFEENVRRGGAAAMEDVDRFFMKADPVHETLRNIASRLDDLRIPYAVAGGMCLVGHGYTQTTVDVDVVITPAGLEEVHRRLERLGYVPLFPGARNLRDVATGVRVKFLVTGEYPGDGKPKPVAFPDPALAAVVIDGIRYLSLEKLIELKLACGMTLKTRLKHLADVQELIRVLALERSIADRLDSYVRDKYLELWQELKGSLPHPWLEPK
jgi:hypothetical protein